MAGGNKSDLPEATWLDRYKLQQRIVSDPSLSRGDAACGWHLVDLYNARHGVAWPSYEVLAARACVARSTAAVSIKKLVDKGYFFVVSRGGIGRANAYRPNFAIVRPTGLSGEGEPSGPPDLNSPAHRTDTVRPAGPYTSYSTEAPSVGGIEVSLPHAAACAGASAARSDQGMDAAFEALWFVFPRHRGKAKARKEFAKLMASGRVSLDHLKVKAIEYGKFMKAKGTREELVPWLHTWLRDEVWDEKYEHHLPEQQPQPGEGSKIAKPEAASKGDKPKRPRSTKGERKETALPPSGGGWDLTRSSVADAVLAKFPIGTRVLSPDIGCGRVEGVIGDKINVCWNQFGTVAMKPDAAKKWRTMG
ncbi:helix-turn-helix domain-containing protein [Azospirillum brasilense]|uniref:helix-turn-helix domain-containing protein n=1 Tax=Azospirillum brasilense TaxID=192 RepID=UPI0013B379DA|nr:helix-turn-helix domain-containing protein [Azospirillum brasilense]